MKCAVMVMICYSLSMVFYGALEIGHDFLHYLAEHHHSHLHSHRHSHDHNMHDHEDHDHHHHHEQVSHHDGGAEHDEPIISVINGFLYTQPAATFTFCNHFQLKLRAGDAPRCLTFFPLPATPPPWRS